MIVIDASATLELLLRTPAAPVIQARLFQPGETLHAPHLLDLEVAQVLRRYAMTGQIGAARCTEVLSDLAALPLDRYPHDLFLPRVWQLRTSFTAYDAVYLALAESLGAPLITMDRRLAASPGHRALIELV